jgi:hypothetical protein
VATVDAGNAEVDGVLTPAITRGTSATHGGAPADAEEPAELGAFDALAAGC